MMKNYIPGLFDDPADGTGTNDGNDGGNEGGSSSGEKLYTKAEMDAYTNGVVSKKKAEWEKNHKTSVKDEAEKLAAMSAQQRAEHDRDEYKAKYEEQLKINQRANLMSGARKIIADAGIVGVSDDLIDRLIGEDADTTKTAVDAFVSAYNTAVQAGITDLAKQQTPRSGTSSGTITKEAILAIKNTDERIAMMRKHRKLFGL